MLTQFKCQTSQQLTQESQEFTELTTRVEQLSQQNTALRHLEEEKGQEILVLLR